MKRSKIGIVGALIFLAGCATTGPQWVTFPDGDSGKGTTLEAWQKKHPLAANQEIRLDEVSRGDSSSAHIVQVRKEEPLHIHQNHDLLVVILKGRGILTLEKRRLEVKPGAILSIPRGIPHSFVNQGSDPAVAFAVFMPAFDGKDRVLVKE